MSTVSTELRTVNVSHVRTYWLSLAGIESRPVPYSQTGASYQPETLVLTFTETREEGESEVDRTDVRVAIIGHRLLKNGKLSKVTIRDKLYYPREWPDWVRETVEKYQGGPDPTRLLLR